MALSDACDQEHASGVEHAAQCGHHREDGQKHPGLNGMEVQEERDKEGYVLRRVAVSANSLGEFGIGDAWGLALAETHARDIRTQPCVEQNQDGGAEKEGVHCGIVRDAIPAAPNVVVNGGPQRRSLRWHGGSRPIRST